jgi:hypothetical protein
MFFAGLAIVAGAEEPVFLAAGDEAGAALFSVFAAGVIAGGGAGLSVGIGVVSIAGAGAGAEGVSSIVVAGCSSAGVDVVVSSSCAKTDAQSDSAMTANSDLNNLI